MRRPRSVVMRSMRRPMSAALWAASRWAARSNVSTHDRCVKNVTALSGTTESSRKAMISRVRSDIYLSSLPRANVRPGASLVSSMEIVCDNPGMRDGMQSQLASMPVARFWRRRRGMVPRVITLSLAAAGLAAFFWSSGEAPGLRVSAEDVALPSADAPAAAPSVRLQHEYIRVTPPAPPAPPAPSRRALPSRTAPLEPRKASSTPAFVERARRALLGDGRHRPEPFPRPAAH